MSKKIPFAQLKKILTTRFTTGGERPTEAPGQTKAPEGSTVPYSVLQAARPDDALRVTKQQRKAVLIVSPFVQEDPANASKMMRYAERATRDSLLKNEAPLATHVFYPSVISTKNPIERDTGLQSQLSWVKGCDVVAAYIDFGITPAMQVVLNQAILKSKRIEYRTIGSVA